MPTLPHVVIPQQLLLFLPVVVATLAGWLATDKLRPWVNALIVVCVVAACTGAAMLLSPQSLSGNVFTDFTTMIAYVLAFVYGPLKPLLSYLSLKSSPFDIFAPRAAVATTLATNGMVSNAATTIPVPWSRTLDATVLPTTTMPAVSPTATATPLDEAHSG